MTESKNYRYNLEMQGTDVRLEFSAKQEDWNHAFCTKEDTSFKAVRINNAILLVPFKDCEEIKSQKNETNYLTASEKNKKRLLKAVKEVKNK